MVYMLVSFLASTTPMSTKPGAIRTAFRMTVTINNFPMCFALSIPLCQNSTEDLLVGQCQVECTWKQCVQCSLNPI